VGRRWTALAALALFAAARTAGAQEAIGRPESPTLPTLAYYYPEITANRLASEPKRRSAFGKAALLPEFAPRSAPAGEALARLRSIDANLIAEAVYFLERSAPVDPIAELEKAAETLRSFSTHEGIQYWSASRNRLWTLYSESYAVDSPRSGKRIPDPRAGEPSEGEGAFVFQRDSTFGGNFYRYDFLSDGASIALVGKNLGDLKYLLLPIIGEGRLETAICAIPVKEGIIVYGLSAARAFLPPGTEGRILASFSNRADALFAWFSRSMGSIYR
jgi:hypothetical protein